MGQVLHGSATTTEAVRRAIQHSQASLRALARRYGISPKTVAKWQKRESTADRRQGRRAPHSTVLWLEEEAVIVAFRRHTLLPLDDCLYASADHPAPDPLVAAPLPAAPRHQPAAGGGRRQAGQDASSRPTRSATSTSTSPRCSTEAGQALPVRGHRPHLASSPSRSCTRRPHGGSPATSSAP